ncbi:sulfotransferase domain-containing protein [Maridesulfovibrio sp.]|uniref:sulfotransferase domain-containing protein n=1 Tax=Maridesulfovibrio sp. TaxID=2795000 RepID=UPI0029CA637E|nr:sulfotransferase domain-containing protein [Maridesulfovibrio sp.]
MADNKKEKEFFIHIGAPKTASTFLQEEYFPYITEALHLGKDVAAVETSRYKKYIGNLAYTNYTALDSSAQDLDEYIEYVSTALGKPVPESKKFIISDEGFFNVYANLLQLPNTMQVLKKVFGDNTKIILTIRQQGSFLESLYKQSLVNGHFSSLNYFLRYANGNFGAYYPDAKYNIEVKTYNWLNIYKQLCAIFPKENILILPYEMLRENPNSFFREFNKFMNISKVEVNHRKKVNKSNSLTALKVLRVLNRLTNNQRNGLPVLIQNPLWPLLPPYSMGEGKVLNSIRNFSDRLNARNFIKIFNLIDKKRGNFISQDVHEKIMEMHSSSNKELDNRLGLNLKKYGYY